MSVQTVNAAPSLWQNVVRQSSEGATKAANWISTTARSVWNAVSSFFTVVLPNLFSRASNAFSALPKEHKIVAIVSTLALAIGAALCFRGPSTAANATAAAPTGTASATTTSTGGTAASASAPAASTTVSTAAGTAPAAPPVVQTTVTPPTQQ